MRTNNVILIVLVAVVLVGLIFVGASTFMPPANNTTNNTTNNNTTVNATVNDTNNTTANQTKTQTTNKKASKSSSDDIPREGKYKGVEYSLHEGSYPYYSPQQDKVYKNRKEEYNDMKNAIDSGIAD